MLKGGDHYESTKKPRAKSGPSPVADMATKRVFACSPKGVQIASAVMRKILFKKIVGGRMKKNFMAVLLIFCGLVHVRSQTVSYQLHDDFQGGLMVGKEYVDLLGVTTDESKADLRREKPIGILVGLASTKGIYIAGAYALSSSNQLQVALGTVPFLELAGYRSTVISTTLNHYFNARRSTSPYASTSVSFETLTSVANEPLGNLYFAAFNLGLDWRWGSGANLFLSAGPAIGHRSKGMTRVILGIDVGLGWHL
jgi:hypothetical protein